MFDVNKCIDILENRMNMPLNYPYIDTEFWIPMSQELAKDEEKALEFIKTLSYKEFLEVSSCLEDVIKITNSENFVKSVEQIAIEKNYNTEIFRPSIEEAYKWLD